MKIENNKKDFLNIKETANLLSVSIPTLKRWIRQGFIISHRSDKDTKFSYIEIKEWIRATGFKVPQNLINKNHDSNFESTSEGMFIQALLNGFFMSYPNPVSRDQLYLDIIEIYSSSTNSDFDKQNLFEKLIHREESYPTLITPEIAIPHTRRNSDFKFSPSTICTAVLKEPIAINTTSPIKTKIFFFLFSEDPQQHLKLLAGIAGAVKNTCNFSDKVFEINSLKELISLLESK